MFHLKLILMYQKGGQSEAIFMKKVVLILFLFVSIISFSYTNISFNFIFTFGSTNTSYSEFVKIHYIDDSVVSTITFKFNRYPQKIYIDEKEYIVYSNTQKFIIGSGKIKVKYKSKEYEFLLENEELEIGFEDVVPNIKLIYYTKEISPNDDWYNDSLRISLYSNTYGILKIFDFEKSISPGKNEFNIPIGLADGKYSTNIRIFNSKGEYTKEITFTVDRSKKTATKYILLTIFSLLIGFIGYNIIK